MPRTLTYNGKIVTYGGKVVVNNINIEDITRILYQPYKQSFTTGTEITSLVDQSTGTQENGTIGASGSRPTFRTSVLNGRAVIEFDGTNDYVGLPLTLLKNKPGASALVVMKRLSGTVSAFPFFVGRGSAQASMRMALNVNAGANAGLGSYAHQYRRQDIDATLQLPVTRISTDWDYFTMVQDYVAGQATFYINGLSVGTAAIAGSAYSDNTDSVSAYLGCSGDATGTRQSFANIQMAQFAFLDRAWTQAEIEALHTQVQTIFGL